MAWMTLQNNAWLSHAMSSTHVDKFIIYLQLSHVLYTCVETATLGKTLLRQPCRSRLWGLQKPELVRPAKAFLGQVQHVLASNVCFEQVL